VLFGLRKHLRIPVISFYYTSLSTAKVTCGIRSWCIWLGMLSGHGLF